MEQKFFDNAQKLIHEHDELTRLKNELVNNNTSVGVFHNDWDGPGLNYTTYSDEVKEFIKKSIDIRLKEIETQFS
jgi:hypothetical protein